MLCVSLDALSSLDALYYPSFFFFKSSDNELWKIYKVYLLILSGNVSIRIEGNIYMNQIACYFEAKE